MWRPPKTQGALRHAYVSVKEVELQDAALSVLGGLHQGSQGVFLPKLQFGGRPGEVPHVKAADHNVTAALPALPRELTQQTCAILGIRPVATEGWKRGAPAAS
jgi:hypothetical protein